MPDATTTPKTVFLSSTSRDLLEYRQAAYRAIERLDGFRCVRMEDFGARDDAADDFCRQKVAECNLFVGVLGNNYGSSPPGCDESFTEREYEAAFAEDKPCLMFLTAEGFATRDELRESDELWQKQQEFRDRVSTERIRDTFTTPEELATKISQAIHNWQQTATGPGRRGVIAMRPRPHLAHPYPLQDNFTGRAPERELLSSWLTGGRETVLAYIAIGGMGKTALTWAWLQRDVLGEELPGQPQDDPDVAQRCRVAEADRPEGVLWWSFYEHEASFAAFVDAALRYTSGGTVDPGEIPSLHEKMQALAYQLQQHRVLLVLDGLERQLQAYANLGAAYQGDKVVEDDRGVYRTFTDPHAGDFIRWLAAVPVQARVLLTSRLFPKELDGLAACRRVELTELTPDEAVAFFAAQSIEGTRAEIQDACRPYGYHPLAVRLLAGMIATDPAKPGDVSVAGEYDVTGDLKPREHNILALAYDALDDDKKQLLSRLAAFRSPMEFDAISAISQLPNERATKTAVRDLVTRGLLLFDRPERRYDLHPIIRQYAYDRLADKQGVHTTLRDYFDAVPTPDEDEVQRVEDLDPVIELYHHTVHAGRFDEASHLFYDRLADTLYFRFGVYQTCIELLLALFPNGQDRPPRLKDQSAQAWTLNDLACNYSLSGQPRRAVSLFEMHNDLRERGNDKKNLAIGLEAVACVGYLPLGELETAERSLRRSIDLCREIGNKTDEAVGHHELGWVLVFRGAPDEAAKELAKSKAYWKRMDNKQALCMNEAGRALRNLLMGHPKAALDAARRALDFYRQNAARSYPVERDFVQAEWLIGWALVELAALELDRREEHLNEADGHLTEAITRCRRINLVEFEPDILLAWARWHRLRGDEDLARERAGEALAIADRCEYRLCQADIHNFLAQLAIDADDRPTAVRHARTARERALCDGPPHCYLPALQTAEAMLEELGGGRREKGEG